MEFNVAENRHEFLYRETDESGIYEIGICPVIFGFRVKGGLVKGVQYEIDWCAGNSREMIIGLFASLKIIMRERTVSQGFTGLPIRSEVKPFFNDAKFIKWLTDAISDKSPASEISKLNIPNLHTLKDEYLETVWTI